MEAAGRAQATIRHYRTVVRRLAGAFPDPWTVTQRDLEAWLAPMALDAKKGARSAIRAFYRWAHGRAYRDDDPAYGLERVRVRRGRRRWPAPELVVSQLVDDVRVPERVRFMGELAAFCGLRRMEIAAVKGSDLLPNGFLTVVGKGNKVRHVPVEDEVLLARLQALGSDEWAFPSRAGGHLTPHAVGILMSKWLPGSWTAHTLRHRFATRSHEDNPDLLALAEVLGHTSVATTMIYVLTPEAKLRAAVAAAGRPRFADDDQLREAQ